MIGRGKQVSWTIRLLAVAVIVAAAALVGIGTPSGAPGGGNASYQSVPAETFRGGVTPEQEISRMSDLHSWLMQQLPAGVSSSPLLVGITDADRNDLQKHAQDKNGPTLVGVAKPISENIRFSGVASALLSPTPVRVGNGFLQATPDGGFVWAMAIQSAGAGAIRIHVGRLDLPADADMFFFNQDGQAFGPYTQKGPNGDGQFWTNTVFGSEGILLVRHYGPDGAADLKSVSFNISDVGHITTKFSQGLTAVTESFCSFNATCIINADCNTTSSIAFPMKTSVALLQWVAGAFIYTCSGSLIADSDTSSQIPYFMTANHCINRAQDAQNVEAYYQFILACGNTNCPAQTNPGGIQRLGSTISVTGTGGDFTLLHMNTAPPTGSTFLGWNNVPIANTNNAALYRISHPAWAPQAYSAGHVDTTAPTCTQWPRGERIYSRTTTGGTEGGSSGSPVVNASSQFVGQLSGACGTNVNDDCDQTNNATVDGAFAFYYSSVAPFLGSTCTPTTEVCNDGIDNDCDGAIDCADSNCSADPSCIGSCGASGTSCTSNSDCCSNNCKGPRNRKTCR